MDTIHILVTLDENYIPPLRTMLKSLFINNPHEVFDIYMIYDNISNGEIQRLESYCNIHGSRLIPVPVDDRLFSDAPVFRYYTKAMYYRLLACTLLPDTLDKVLYMDPDTLVINPIRALYDTDLSGHLFGAAIHVGLTNISEQVNKIRLGTYETEGYYNSGVLLMNLKLQREIIREEDIFDYVKKHQKELIMPDQDILNGLYGEQILPMDDSLYNYDAHRYETYRMVSGGKKDLDWVMENTVILHFCGKIKPWIKSSRSRYGILFKHYTSLAEHTLREMDMNPVVHGNPIHRTSPTI